MGKAHCSPELEPGHTYSTSKLTADDPLSKVLFKKRSNPGSTKANKLRIKQDLNPDPAPQHNSM